MTRVPLYPTFVDQHGMVYEAGFGRWGEIIIRSITSCAEIQVAKFSELGH